MSTISDTQLIILIIFGCIIYFAKNPNQYDKFIYWIETTFSFKKPKPVKMKLMTPKFDLSNTTHANMINSNTTNSNIPTVEKWRDLPFVGTSTNGTYHMQDSNSTNISRKNLPIYYPISSPMEDTYFNYLNSVTSPKLSMLRNIMRKVELYTNQGIKPIIFNNAERPIEIKSNNLKRIQVLANIIIELINEFGKSSLQVKQLDIQNPIHEETDEQSRIEFDVKLQLLYSNSEHMGKISKPDIVIIQSEFIFEKNYSILPEDDFFIDNKKIEFRAYLSKLIVVGSEHVGFLGGRFGAKSGKYTGKHN